MKILFLIAVVLSLGLGNLASAAPRMDTAIGSGTVMFATVLPDHQDPNLYYVFPQSSAVLTNQDGESSFLYLENRKYRLFGGYRVLSAQLQLGLKVSIENPDLKAKMDEIKTQNPNAKFSVITAFKTEVIESKKINSFFLDSSCPEVGGPLEVPIFCTVNINPILSAGFRSLIQNTEIAVLNLAYHFYGFADGKIMEFEFTVPLNVGSLDNNHYFVDQNGSPLYD